MPASPITIPESEVHCPSTEWRFIHAGIVKSKGLSCNYLLKTRGYPPRGGRSAGRGARFLENRKRYGDQIFLPDPRKKENPFERREIFVSNCKKR